MPRAVLASLEGMTLIAAEQAINAALSAVKGVVNAFVHANGLIAEFGSVDILVPLCTR
jgi:hypothetical protein